MESNRFVMPSESKWGLSRVGRSIALVQGHLRTHPGPWVASAVGAGFGLGLFGRLLVHRKMHRGMPEVIVLSGVC